MTYDLHPIFVHFPIALLFFYSVLKILPFTTWFPKFAWKEVQFVLLVGGVLGAFAALTTGDMAAGDLENKLIETHEFFAVSSTWIYSALLAGYVLLFANVTLIPKIGVEILTKVALWAEKILTNNMLSKILALFGLVAITITGLLGGVMVYGTSADPLAGFVLRILGITI